MPQKSLNWDESEHPRNSNGEFTDKGDSSTLAKKPTDTTYYHGTWSPHTGFKKEKGTFYITDDKEYASSYKREGGDLLTIKISPDAKILDTRNPQDMAVAEKIISDHPSMGYYGSKSFIEKKFKNGLPSWGASDLIDEIQKLGYDGMHISERSGDHVVNSIAVFNPGIVAADNPTPVGDDKRSISTGFSGSVRSQIAATESHANDLGGAEVVRMVKSAGVTDEMLDRTGLDLSPETESVHFETGADARDHVRSAVAQAKSFLNRLRKELSSEGVEFTPGPVVPSEQFKQSSTHLFRSHSSKIGSAVAEEINRLLGKNVASVEVGREIAAGNSSHDEIAKAVENYVDDYRVANRIESQQPSTPVAQRLMFDIDPNKTKRLFEDALVETSKQSKKRKIVEKPAAPSLLEKIGDDLKKMHEESRPLGGQKEFFSRMRDAIDQYASKPSRLNLKSPQRQGSKKGRWVTLHGAHVFIVDGKITKGPSHLVGKGASDISPGDKRRAVRSKSLAGEWVVEKDPKWKNVRIPSIKFKEWIEGDEPEVKIPKSKRGAAVYDAAKQAAESAELPLEHVLNLMPDAHNFLKQEQDSREKAKAELRRVSGLTAGKLARLENTYFDHSSLKNWDTTAREFAMNHPELGYDPESHDLPALLWDFIREGKLPHIPSYDPRVAELAAIWAKPKKRAVDERMPGDEDDSHQTIESRHDESVPFSRRAIAEKFSRAFTLSVRELLSAEVRRAANETDTRPSDEQRKAGNYRKGKFRWNGLTIAIENPAGSVRSGKSASGVAWSVQMKNHYGYILRNVSEADGDHVDVFVGPSPESDLVCVVDQKNPSGRFDEHKVMIGFTSADEAKNAYLANYSDGWKGFESITPMTVGQFKSWLDHGETRKRICDQVSRYRRVATAIRRDVADKFSRIFSNPQKLDLRSF